MNSLLILNPASGRRDLRKAEEVLRRLEQVGEARLAQTEGRGHARRLATEALAAGASLVVGCGGDGTLQEIASALAGSGAAMGIVPVGRCNDFARALGFTLKETPSQLADILISGPTRRVDVGVVEPSAAASVPAVAVPHPAFSTDRPAFCTVATLGFDSSVNRYVEQHRLALKGTAAYLYAIARVLMNLKCPRVRLRGDFGLFEGEILLAATANSPFYGGAMHIAPGARLDDGLFHVCIVRAVHRCTVLRMLPKVMRGAHLSHPAVQLAKTSYLDIQTPDGPEWVCADGESLAQTPLVLRNIARVLQVRAPESGV